MLIQMLDTSSSEDSPTGIAHHAQHPTRDIQPQELPKTETPESASMLLDHGELQDGCQDGHTKSRADTALDTRSQHSTTEQLMHAVNGFNPLTQKPNTSCTD